MYKYVVLDFGGVLVEPTTGYWDITPTFLKLIDINNIDKDILKDNIKKYSYIKDEKIINLDEEYNMFIRYYENILRDFNISNEVINKIAYDRVYNFDRYRIFNKVYDELDNLKDKYKLILFTDNWPCVISYLKEFKLDKYFDKIYVSSVYGVLKKDKVFFDYLINDYNIKPREAIFIDDNEVNLDVAKDKGLDVLLMDRNNNKTSKYKVIDNLFDI